MPVFSASGRAHRILAQLARGPSQAAEILDGAAKTERRVERSKCWRALKALKDHGLISLRDGLYRITEDGRDALASLEAGRDYVAAVAEPSVRVFGRREAA